MTSTAKPGESRDKGTTQGEKVVTVAAHCLLNPLTRVKGLAPVPFRPEGPTVQLPCPEALYLGLERWAVTRNQLDVPQFRRFCRALIEDYVDLLEMLAREGARLRIVGVAGSPSCGVDYYEQRLHRRTGYGRSRARARERAGRVHGGAAGGAGAAGCGFARVEEVGKKEGTGGDS